MEIADLTGRIEYVNSAFERLTGYSSSDAIGRTPREMFRAGTHGEDHYQAIWETISRGDVWRGSLVGRRPDGSLSFQEGTIAGVRGPHGQPVKLVALKRDVAQAPADPIGSSESRVRSLLWQAADPLIIHDRDGRVHEVNERACASLGYSRDELRGMSITDYDDSVEAADFDALWRTLAGGGMIGVETTFRRKSGDTFDAEVRHGRIELGGSSFILSLARDVSERRRAELALRQANAALAAARDAAMRANKAMTTLLATISHDIRTPLNAINGYAELLIELSDESDDDRFRDDLERILRATSHVLRLVDDLIDLTRIESGRLSLSREPLSLRGFIDELADTIRSLADRGANRLAVTVASERAAIETDATRLRQILINLLGNACKFTRDGTITLAVEDRGPMVALLISDTGIGIDPNQLDHIFEPFQQADESIQATYGGSGLGLAISRKLARAMGGELSATSEPGVGSTFTLTLPLALP
ncbi:MAG: PAS domain S-box protein [Nannocystaceae bacterium]